MKGDFSRFTHDPTKRYTRVRKPQGRVNTDADWNEQVDIALRRARVETKDVIGLCGVPRATDGFRIGLDLYGVGSTPDVDWAVGANGLVLKRSVLGGRVWEVIASPIKLRSGLLIDVCAFPEEGNVAWVVGTQGTILFTENGGETWIRQRVPPEVAGLDLYAVHFPGGELKGLGWAVGAQGTLLQTEDWGEHWAIAEGLPEFTDPGPALSGICVAGDVVCVVGANATILFRETTGAEWSQAQTPFEDPGLAPHLFGVAAIGTVTRRFCAVGEDRSVLFANIDSPKEWALVDLSPLALEPGNLWDVAGSIGSRLAGVVGDKGVFLAWDDDAGGFKRQEFPWPHDLYDVCYANETLRVVGQGGVILESESQGEDWKVWRDLPILGGRIYVDGILCESDEPTLYSRQPNLPDPPPPEEGNAVDLVYLDVWERPVDEIGDPSLVDEAFGIPTADRVQTIWQVRLQRLPDLDLALENFQVTPFLPSSPGAAWLSTRAEAPTGSTDRCSMAAGGGYRGLENRLYRVEVHHAGQPHGWRRAGGGTGTGILSVGSDGDGHTTIKVPLTALGDAPWKVGPIEVFVEAEGPGPVAQIGFVAEEADGAVLGLDRQLAGITVSHRVQRIATFKWSRDNGSTAYKIESFDSKDPKKLTLADLGRDRITSLKVGDLVESIDDDTELNSKPGVIARVASGGINNTSQEVTLTANVAGGNTSKHPRLIRWDHSDLSDAELAGGAVPIAEGIWIDLEDGVQVRFGMGGEYRSCDYWIFTARATKGKVEELVDAPPHGIKHHFCPLAMIEWRDGVPRIDDRRDLFDPLTEMTRFFHVGGTGQETMPKPNPTLPRPLEVGVANGRWSVEGAKVRFETEDGGSLHSGNQHGSSVHAITDFNGVAQCVWELGADKHDQQVIATLLAPSGAPVEGVAPLAFDANLSLAREVYFEGAEGCDPAETTVQAVLEELCQRPIGGTSGSLCTVTLGVDDGAEDLEQAIDQLLDLSPEGGCICVPAGDWVQESTVVIENQVPGDRIQERPITIRGCGRASRILLRGDSTQIEVKNSQSVTIRDLAIGGSYGGGPLIQLSRSYNCLLENLNVTNSEGDCAVELSGCRNVRVARCTLSSVRRGLVIESGGVDLTIEGCSVNAVYGLILGGEHTDSLVVRDNRFEAGGLGLQIKSLADGEFVRNDIMVKDGGQGMVFLKGLPDGAEILIAQNVISPPLSSSAEVTGIVFEGLPYGAEILIARNVISAPKSSSVAVTMNGMGKSARLTLAENRIEGGSGVDVSRMDQDSRLILRDNRVTTTKGPAVDVARELGCGDVRVHGNVFIFESTERMPAISIGGQVDDGEKGIPHVLFSDNQVHSLADAPDPGTGTVVLNASRVVALGNYVQDSRTDWGWGNREQPRQPGASIFLREAPEAATATGNVTRNGVRHEGYPDQYVIVVNNAILRR